MKIEFELHEFKLDNGLKVIINPDHSAPYAAVNLWYNVGSKDEKIGETGIAHLFEHLMFQGSKNVASGEHLSLLESYGGSCNATTSYDRTVYYNLVPSAALDLALWLEADRMASLDSALNQSNLDNQREVVIEEKRQRYDNQPYRNLGADIFAMIFPSDHPYGHPVIGETEDLANFNIPAALAFYQKYYKPNNACLAIVGDVEVAETLAKVETYFGSIPSGSSLPARKTTLINRPNKLVDYKYLEIPEAAISWVWPVPNLKDPDYLPLTILAKTIFSGAASEIYREFILDNPRLSHINLNFSPLHDSSAVADLHIRILDGQNPRKLEQLVVEKVTAALATKPDSETLLRIKRQTERGILSGLNEFLSRANTINSTWAIYQNLDYFYINLERLENLTIADLLAVRHYLDFNNAAKLYHLPKDSQYAN